MTAGGNRAGGGAKSPGITASIDGEDAACVGATSNTGVPPVVGVEASGADCAQCPGLLERCLPHGRWLAVAVPVVVSMVAVLASWLSSDPNSAADSGDSIVGDLDTTPCDQGEFRLPGMTTCRPLLDCPELAEIEILELIGQGSTKSVYRALWRGYEVAIAALAEPDLRSDFQHGLRMLQALSPSQHVVQLVGHCGDVIVTEFHARGDASGVAEEVRAVGGASGALLGLSFCRSYAAALAFLHDSPAGRRVMCDSNDLVKTLQQWLVTEEGALVAADLDALPDAAAGPVHCGRRRIEGEFLAPEQRWRHGREPPGYDEKTDVWKLPAVCKHFMGETPDGEYVKLELHAIHNRCRSLSPLERPSVAEVVTEYDRVMDAMIKSA